MRFLCHRILRAELSGGCRAASQGAAQKRQDRDRRFHNGWGLADRCSV